MNVRRTAAPCACEDALQATIEVDARRNEKRVERFKPLRDRSGCRDAEFVGHQFLAKTSEPPTPVYVSAY